MRHVHDHFKEFLTMLNEAGVEYLVVGGYAVCQHGYVRLTDDLDVWVAMEPKNAARMADIMQQFAGVPVPIRKFTEPDQVLEMGQAPTRLHIMTTIDGVTFEECYKRRIETEMDGVPVHMISLEDLKRNKRASGRPKDIADLEEL